MLITNSNCFYSIRETQLFQLLAIIQIIWRINFQVAGIKNIYIVYEFRWTSLELNKLQEPSGAISRDYQRRRKLENDANEDFLRDCFDARHRLSRNPSQTLRILSRLHREYPREKLHFSVNQSSMLWYF